MKLGYQRKSQEESCSLLLREVCIDQVDVSRKTAGIRSLGAFLTSSQTLLVVFSKEYFTRLWSAAAEGGS